MTIQECYDRFGGDYDEVLARLRSERLITKFAVKFLSDGSYEALKNALDAGQMEDAFRAAHTLKGVGQNLAFTELYKASHALTEVLRPGAALPPQETIQALFEQVQKEYEKTADALREFSEAMN